MLTKEPGECIDVFFDTDASMFDKACIIDGTPKLRTLFQEINELWYKKADGYYYRSMAILYQIFAELDDCHSTKRKRTTNFDKISLGIDYINEHFRDKEINLEALSVHCGISYSYFRRLFEKHIGLPPAKYISQKRIAYAKELLSSGQYMVYEVAEAAGFNDPLYFSRAFKSETGYTPKEFANMIYSG